MDNQGYYYHCYYHYSLITLRLLSFIIPIIESTGRGRGRDERPVWITVGTFKTKRQDGGCNGGV